MIYIEGAHVPTDDDDGPRIYEAPDARAEWLRSIKHGDVALVATIGRAGATRGDIGDAITSIRKAGAVLIEVGTGRRSDDLDVLAEMMIDGLDELSHRHKYTSTTAKAARAKQVLKHGQSRLSRSAALKIWRDIANYPTIADAVAHMPGWSKRTASRRLLSRHGRDPSRGGRPRSKK